MRGRGQHTLQFLFTPERAARLIEQHARTPDSPGFDEVLGAIVAATWKARREPGLRGEIGRVVDHVVLSDLMVLSRSDNASPQTRALATLELSNLKLWVQAAAAKAKDPSERAHLAYAEQEITEFQRDLKQLALPPATPPDGPPIGSDEADDD